jgi:hypothetical protein
MIKILLLSITISFGLVSNVFANKFNFENGAFLECYSTSGAYTTRSSNYETYAHRPIRFTILIDSFGEMRIKAGDVLDFAHFKSVEGNADRGNYYGVSYYSSFQLERADGRFFFVQNMPNEAFMITGLCDRK